MSRRNVQRLTTPFTNRQASLDGWGSQLQSATANPSSQAEYEITESQLRAAGITSSALRNTLIKMSRSGEPTLTYGAQIALAFRSRLRVISQREGYIAIDATSIKEPEKTVRHLVFDLADTTSTRQGKPGAPEMRKAIMTEITRGCTNINVVVPRYIGGASAFELATVANVAVAPGAVITLNDKSPSTYAQEIRPVLGNSGL